MTAHTLMLLLAALAVAGDVLTTVYALRKGARETSPFYRDLPKPAVAVVRVVGVAICLIAAYLLRARGVEDWAAFVTGAAFSPGLYGTVLNLPVCVRLWRRR